jgi:hypothetical protein
LGVNGFAHAIVEVALNEFDEDGDGENDDGENVIVNGDVANDFLKGTTEKFDR